MSRRCPSCGMESADDAAWCDFCKEPFRKKPEPASPPKPEPALKPRAETLSQEELLKRLPSEFVRGDDGLRMPKLPPWFKWLAWAFLGSWLVSGMILFGLLYARKKGAESAPPARTPGGYDSGVITVPSR